MLSQSVTGLNWLTAVAKQLFCMVRSSLRIFDLVCPLHVVDVHTDLVLELWGEIGGVGVDTSENDPGPELPVLQQHHGFVDHSLLTGNWLQLV